MISKRLQIAIAVFLAIAVTLLCIRMYLRWSIEYRYGRIVRVDQQELTLKTSRNEEVQVVADRDTRVLQGREAFHGESLLDKNVIVVGSKTLSGKIEAKTIRIVKPPAR